MPRSHSTPTVSTQQSESLVEVNTQVKGLYGLALSLAVSGTDIPGIAGSYGLTVHAVLQPPTQEAWANALGT